MPADTVPETPWKPRITLMAEVTDLLDRGMADDYNHESEHSAMGEAATGADLPPPKLGRGPNTTTGHLFSSKHTGGGDFPGE